MVFGINMVVLDNGQFKVFNLKQMLEVFIFYCCEVVICCIVFELCKVRECVYIFEGLVIVLVNIDLVIDLIKVLFSLVDVKKVLVL